MRPKTPKTDRIKKILFVIAKEGPLNTYGICQKLEGATTKPTVRRDLWDLRLQNRIERVKTVKKTRGPRRSSEYFDLSAPGFIWIMANAALNEISKELDFSKAAKKYLRFFPAAFAVWDEIVRLNVERVALRRLQYTCQLTWPRLANNLPMRGQAMAFPQRLERFEDYRPFLDATFLDLSYELGPYSGLRASSFQEDDRKWQEALRNSERLRIRTATAMHARLIGLVNEATEKLTSLGFPFSSDEFIRSSLKDE